MLSQLSNTIQIAPDDMQVDAVNTQMGTGSVGNNFNSQLEDAPPGDVTASRGEETDEEYGSWEGFGSSAYLFFSSQPVPLITRPNSLILPHPAVQISKIVQNKTKATSRKLLKEKISAGSRVQKTSAGKTSKKRKAPSVAEKYVADYLSSDSTQMT